MFDLGDTVALQWTSAQGAPGSGPVVLTLTLPDGSSVTPSVTGPVSGTWSASYLTTQAGRHTARWTSSASAFTDAFDVDDSTSTAIVSLADVREQLRFTSTASDEQLRLFIDAATDFIESRVGPVVRRTIVSPPVFPSNGVVEVPPPVVSLTSVSTALGYPTRVYDVSTMYVDGAAGIIRVGPYQPTLTYPVTITYVGGRPIVPPLLRKAALDYIQWMWESQRGPANPVDLLQGDEFSVAAPATVPYRILQALEPFTTPVVA